MPKDRFLKALFGGLIFYEKTRENNGQVSLSAPGDLPFAAKTNTDAEAKCHV